jgi:multidrug resistance efflux pump
MTAEPGPPPPLPEEAPAPKPKGWRPRPLSPLATMGVLLLALCGVAAILAAWGLPPFRGGTEVTDNAYVRGRVTVISPQVSGYVVEVPVKDFQQVQAGQVLVRIDDRIYRARVDQARANIDSQEASLANSIQAEASKQAALRSQIAGIGNAQAQLSKAETDMRRVDALIRNGWVSQSVRDTTVAALRNAQAQHRQARAAADIGREDIRTVQVGREGLKAAVEGAKAQADLAQIDLDHTVIRAPEPGQVSEVAVRNGQYVTNGTQLLFLVPERPWVIANYKEAQTRRIRPGQRASFTVDALGGQRIRGHVESLSPAAGSEFAVLKADNATGNFVKVPQRIAVRIAIDPGQPLAARLRPGMSVEARVETR